ncbi:MAG: adenylate kinase [Caldilineaceae bacterium]|nr:adenylate kinase [Caldilineaceae bacterium]
MRILIIGATGSGKSTLAAELAERLALPHIEMDALFWGPNWTPVERTTFIARVEEALAEENWIMDGNYNSVLGALTWGYADVIVWLDFPLRVNLRRLLRRSINRAATGKDLWQSGNRESWRRLFLSRDSIFVWALKTHKRNRLRYGQRFADPAYAHLTRLRITSPNNTAQQVITALCASPPARPTQSA